MHKLSLIKFRKKGVEMEDNQRFLEDQIYKQRVVGKNTKEELSEVSQEFDMLYL